MIDAAILRDYLLLFLLPLWTMVGLADWACHRRAGIERFGLYEPVLHLVLIALAGAPILMGLFLDINAPVLLLMLLCFLAHEAVGYADIRWATARRGIPPLEQRLHDYLAAVPFAALGFVAVLKWRVIEGLLRDPGTALAAGLHLRPEPLPWPVVGAILALVTLLNILPYAEEFIRAARYVRRRDDQR
jgi:hypothetical protein